MNAIRFPPSSLRDGSLSSSTTSLSPELEHIPPLPADAKEPTLKSTMKNTYSPFFPPTPRPFLLPNVNTSGSNPNPNQSNPKIDHSKYRSWPRPERAGFVKSVRRPSSQLFKRDKNDGDAASRNPSSSISVLVSEALNVSTAHTTPNILRRFSRSHSKRSGAVSIITVNWDPPKNCSEKKVGGKGCIHSPVSEVTSVSPAIVEPLDPVPTVPLEETGKEENMCPETTSDDPDPLSLPLPPPPCPPSPLVELVNPVQPPGDPQEVDQFFHHNDPPLSDDWSVTSSSGHLRLPTTTDIALTTPPTDRTAQPPLAQLPPSSASAAPSLDRDEYEEIPEPYIPPSTAPTTSSPTPNARPSYLFEPVFTWWLSKDIPSYPYLYF